jgi:hypothetical protein
VLTARYALSPYIKHICFVFKGLMQASVFEQGGNCVSNIKTVAAYISFACAGVHVLVGS